MPPYRFFACRDKNIIDNVAFFVLTFSFDVFGRFWAKKNSKKSVHGSLRRRFFMSVELFWPFQKLLFELWSPNTSRYKKVYKTKKFPFDEIYLECGLRFELKPLLKALEPKNYIFNYRHYLRKLKK